MNFALRSCFRWKVRTEDGLLKDPMDEWGCSHPLSVQYPTRELAIEEYARMINMEIRVPNSMILVEEHYRDLNWDE